MSVVISGKNLAVTWDGATVSDVKSVTFDDDPNLQAYGSSGTSGRKARIPGTGDLTGSMEIVGVGSGGPSSGLFDSGDTGTLVVIEDSNLITDHTHTMVVRIGRISVTVDADDGTIVGYNVSFEGNGAYTKS